MTSESWEEEMYGVYAPFKVQHSANIVSTPWSVMCFRVNLHQLQIKASQMRGAGCIYPSMAIMRNIFLLLHIFKISF